MASKKSPVVKKSPARAAKKKPAEMRGARVVSVFGPFGSRVLVDMPTRVAEDIFEGDLGACASSWVVDAIRSDLESYPEDLRSSALAAVAVALGFELEHPGNSATSKSMCAGQLRDALTELRALRPPAEESDGVTRIEELRAVRREAAARAG